MYSQPIIYWVQYHYNMESCWILESFAAHIKHTFRLSALSSVCSKCKSFHIFSIKLSDINSCWPAKSSVSFTTPTKAFWNENLEIMTYMYIYSVNTIIYIHRACYTHLHTWFESLLVIFSCDFSVWTITNHFVSLQEMKEKTAVVDNWDLRNSLESLLTI